MFSYFKKKLYIKIFGHIKYARKLGVKIGNDCRIYISAWGTEPSLIEIGDNVTITSEVVLLTHDGASCLVKNNEGKRYYKYGAIKIADNVFIGYRSIIMPGVEIGSNVVIAAGSIVTKNVESNQVVGGNPAKQICAFDDFTKKIKNNFNTEKY